MAQRLMALVIGIALIIGGIALFRYAGNSQDRAANFSQAQRVEATQLAEGYVAVEGSTAVNSQELPLLCPAGEAAASCAYVKMTTERYTSDRKEKCGTLADTDVIVSYTRQECTTNGNTNSCEDCYMVDTYKWEVQNTESEFAPFTIGSYNVTPDVSTKWDGTQTETIYDKNVNTSRLVVGDQRVTMEYMPTANIRLVSGIANSTGEVADGGSDKPLRISTQTYEALLSDLEKQDATMKWVLRIIGVVLGLIGLAIGASAFSMRNTLLGRVMQGFKRNNNSTPGTGSGPSPV